MSLRSRSENRPTTTPVMNITAPREMYPSAATWTVLITLHAGTSANPIVAPITPAAHAELDRQQRDRDHVEVRQQRVAGR